MEGILFWEEWRLLFNGRKVFYFGKIGCLMEGILFWEDRLLNGRYFILGRYRLLNGRYFILGR